VRKTNADQLTRIDKLKKQVDTQDTSIQDLKRAALTDQTEIKDLRAKFRLAEAERAGLQTKYNEAVRTKQTSDSTKAARLDELNKRDQRIAELERVMSVEKKRREEVESKLRAAVSTKVEDEKRRSGENAKTRTRLEQAEAETAQVRAELDADQKHSEAQREELMAQVEVLRDMLLQAAMHYGKLVLETVSRVVHDELRHEYSSLQFHTFRLERKLANTEAQVAELASLIRQSQDANSLLENELRAAEEERNWNIAALEDAQADLRSGQFDTSHASLTDTLATSQKEHLLSELEIQGAFSSSESRSAKFYSRLNCELVALCAAMRTELDAELLVSQTRAIELQTAKALQDVTCTDLHAARTELESTKKQLEEVSSSLNAIRAKEGALVQEVKEVRSQNKEQTTIHKQALEKEKETATRLASSLQQSKVAEEELRTEINQWVVIIILEPFV
jgi:chromosome segregation ATPase